jgi:hypothetical protein
MKRYDKKSLMKRTCGILRSNEGTSLVLVSIIAIIIVAGVVILHVTTSSLWASADLQRYQDQAYVLATSMGDSIDDLVDAGKMDLSSYAANHTVITDDNLSAQTVVVTVSQNSSGNYEVTVTATAGNGMATYIYKATYRGSGTSYSRVY